MGKRMRNLMYNVLIAVGLFLFWTLIAILIVFRQELFEFIKTVYLSGTWKTIVISAFPVGITAFMIRNDIK